MITYQFGAKIKAEELANLFVGTSWADGRTPEKITVLLRNTPLHVSAWYGEQMVGFLRAMTDEVYRAVLDDLVVDEKFRGQEIGETMMNQMMERLRNVEEVSLDCEEELVPYYKKFGFLSDQFHCLRVWRRKK
ncbi:MAG: GNAT family N-acetyltransferase [Candidatus Moraniibacteriota bacterium]